LDAGGRTIGFLASGVDQITPTGHIKLGEAIARRGALISAFAPGEPARRGNFVARNRLVAGISLGVLVTEGAIKSGTKITADYAREQGKPIFAVPGPITSLMSQGPSELLKHGAYLVTGAKDIIRQLFKSDGLENNYFRKFNTEIALPKDPIQIKIKSIMDKDDGIDADGLARQLKLPVGQVGQSLTMMEIAGWVKQLDGKWHRV
jgi:DNA processing protein